MPMTAGQHRNELTAFRIQLAKMSGDVLLDLKIKFDDLKPAAKADKPLRHGQRELLGQALRREFGQDVLRKLQERRDFLERHP